MSMSSVFSVPLCAVWVSVYTTEAAVCGSGAFKHRFPLTTQLARAVLGAAAPFVFDGQVPQQQQQQQQQQQAGGSPRKQVGVGGVAEAQKKKNGTAQQDAELQNLLAEIYAPPSGPPDPSRIPAAAREMTRHDLLSGPLNDTVMQFYQKHQRSSIDPKDLIHESTLKAKLSNRCHHGLLGILKVIRMTDPDLNIVALGMDLTTLGLNLNSPESLYSSFSSPWAEAPLQSSDTPEFSLPSCYYTNPNLHKVEVSTLKKVNDDTLLYIFYNCPRDVFQPQAANELVNRKWRFLRDKALWLKEETDSTTDSKQWTYYDTETGQKKTYVGPPPLEKDLLESAQAIAQLAQQTMPKAGPPSADATKTQQQQQQSQQSPASASGSSGGQKTDG